MSMKLWHHRALAWTLGFFTFLLANLVLLYGFGVWTETGMISVTPFTYAVVRGIPFWVGGLVFCYASWKDYGGAEITQGWTPTRHAKGGRIDEDGRSALDRG